MLVQSYLFFDGRCEEAIEFYKKALGAKVDMLMRYKDSPDAQAARNVPGEKVMHASFHIGDTQVMASDGHNAGKPHFEGFSLSITVPDEAKAKQCFNALAEGGEVQMPLTKTFFSPSFGMLADRFGVGWMVMAESKEHR